MRKKVLKSRGCVPGVTSELKPAYGESCHYPEEESSFFPWVLTVNSPCVRHKIKAWSLSFRNLQSLRLQQGWETNSINTIWSQKCRISILSRNLHCTRFMGTLKFPERWWCCRHLQGIDKLMSSSLACGWFTSLLQLSNRIPGDI